MIGESIASVGGGKEVTYGESKEGLGHESRLVSFGTSSITSHDKEFVPTKKESILQEE